MPRPIDGKGREKWRGYLSSLDHCRRDKSFVPF